MNIEIRRISAQETYDLRHQVMWPNKPIEYVKLSSDEEGVHFGLKKGLSVVSVVSLFMKGNRAQFRKFATKESEQGNGYGTLLLEHLMAFVFNEKVEAVWCNARTDKTSFYEKFGMVQTSETFTKGGLDYIVMEKRLREKEG